MSIKVMQMDICDGCADLDLKTEHHFSDNQLLYTQVFCKNYNICNRAYKAGKKQLCKHGTWKKNGFEKFICSECGATLSGSAIFIYENENYCYKCGTRMDGGEEDEKQQDQEGRTDIKKIQKE